MLFAACFSVLTIITKSTEYFVFIYLQLVDMGRHPRFPPCLGLYVGHPPPQPPHPISLLLSPW